MTIDNLRIIPKKDVIELRGISKSTHKRSIELGLYLPPIALSERKQGYLATEVKRLQSAVIAGLDKESVKGLVIELQQEREALLAV